MAQTLHEAGEILAAGQHEHPSGGPQGMNGKERQVRQQWSGGSVGGRKGHDGVDGFSLDDLVQAGQRRGVKG